jgi:hypothetical protein
MLYSARILRRVLQSNPNRRTSLRGNLLLRELLRTDAELLEPYVQRVELTTGAVVAAPDAPLATVYFPETVVLCFRDTRRGDCQPAVGLVGLEGMVGWPLLMGGERSPFLAAVEMHGGTALTLPASRLLEACAVSETLRAALLRYADSFILQLASTICSNLADTMERRIARWILMLHDRSEGDALDLTHDHLANALHVRRASVTDCLHCLEGDQVVRCTRGKLVVRDRARLEQIAGFAYGAAEARYAVEIAPFGRG